MQKIAVTALVVAVVVASIVFYGQPVEAQDDQILAGCNLPKSYGRLVSLMNAPNNGLAGQAVFEAEDGTVRWVALAFSTELAQMPKPSRLAAPIFPQLPRYECALGHVWQRH